MPTGASRCSGSAASSRSIGDDVLPVAPLDALKAGAGADVDLLIGTNAEEMNLYLVPTGVRAKVGRPARVAGRCANRCPRAWAMLKAYGMGTAPEPGDVFCRRDERPRVPLARAALRRSASRADAFLRVRLALADVRRRAGRGARDGAAVRVRLPAVATGPEGLCGANPPQASGRPRPRPVGPVRHRRAPCPGPNSIARRGRSTSSSAGEAVHEPVMPAARLPAAEPELDVSRPLSPRRRSRVRHRRRAGHRLLLSPKRWPKRARRSRSPTATARRSQRDASARRRRGMTSPASCST